MCASVSMLLLTKHSAPRLEVAANNACTVTAQLVLAALEVSQDAGTGDSVQVELEERSEVRLGLGEEGRGGEKGRDHLKGGEAWRGMKRLVREWRSQE